MLKNKKNNCYKNKITETLALSKLISRSQYFVSAEE